VFALAGCHLVFPHSPGGDARVDRAMAGLDALPLDVPRLGEGILLPGDGGTGADAAADAGAHEAGLPPGPFCKAQVPYLYCNDFDSSIAGWSADGTTGPGFIDAKPADGGGRTTSTGARTSATLPVGPGESFTLALERDGSAPAEEKNMNVGIDELVVRGLP
jgi:hypothetical protein